MDLNRKYNGNKSKPKESSSIQKLMQGMLNRQLSRLFSPLFKHTDVHFESKDVHILHIISFQLTVTLLASVQQGEGREGFSRQQRIRLVTIRGHVANEKAAIEFKYTVLFNSLIPLPLPHETFSLAQEEKKSAGR